MFSYQFSWDHDSEHYELGVEALHVEDIVRDLRTPATPLRGRSDGARKKDNFEGNFGETIDHFPEPPRSALSASEESLPLPQPWNRITSPPKSSAKSPPDSPEYEFDAPRTSARPAGAGHTVHFSTSASELDFPSPPASARRSGSAAASVQFSASADEMDPSSPPTSARPLDTSLSGRFPEGIASPTTAWKTPTGASRNPTAAKKAVQAVARQEYYLSSSSDEEEKV
jgi:hypothetical protein